MHLSSADKISANNTLWGHFVAGDFRRQNPKVSCPQGLREELDYEMQDEEIRQEQYSHLVQVFAVTAKDGWSNDNWVTS